MTSTIASIKAALGELHEEQHETITSTKGKLAIFMKIGDGWIPLAKATDQEQADRIRTQIQDFHKERQFGPFEMKIEDAQEEGQS